MTGPLYVSMLRNGQGGAGPERAAQSPYSYVIAVPEPHREEVRRGLAKLFPGPVNTVVRNVFIVETALPVGEFRTAFLGIAAGCGSPLDVKFVEEMNWTEISRCFAPPSAAA